MSCSYFLVRGYEIPREKSLVRGSCLKLPPHHSVTALIWRIGQIISENNLNFVAYYVKENISWKKNTRNKKGLDEYVGLRCATGPGCLLLLVGLASVRASLRTKVVGIATAGTHQDGRSLAKGTKKRLYPWPAFFTCTAFYRTGTPFSARAIRFTRSCCKKTLAVTLFTAESMLSRLGTCAQAFPSTVSSKTCLYSKSFFFLKIKRQQ
jgi:hypothetical protein